MADVLVMLALSPTMEEGQLIRWMKVEGDTVSSGDVVAEVETDKATMELESFLDGVLLKRVVPEGSMVKVGSPIAVIGEDGDDIEEALAGAEVPVAEPQAAASPTAPEVQAAAPAAAAVSTGRGDGRIVASPLARKMAADAGLSLAQISGTGPHGRIIKRDVESALQSGHRAGAATPGRAFVPTPFTGPWAEDVPAQPLSNVRKVIARRLTESWVTAPHFFLEMEIRMDRAAEVRSQINEGLAKIEGGKISFNDLVVKACALALQEHPAVNAAFDDSGMRHFKGSHIGVAVAIPDGLVVPVIRDAHYKSLREISAETRDLATRARDKKLKPQEMTGSTFSVSNLGMFGIDRFTAVLNPPEACIMAIGALKKVPVVESDDSIRVARVMVVTLSCDHRAVDGATGALFLQSFKGYLENPMLMLV